MPKRTSLNRTNRAASRSGQSGNQFSRLRQMMQSGAFTVFAVFVIVIIGISLTKEIIRKIEVNRQIATLEQEIQSIEDQNAELSELVQYFNSSSFQEKEARSKLGLQGEGESVVIVPQELDVQATAEADQTATALNESNVSKWKRYFFN